MKICVLLSSLDGTNSSFEDDNTYQNPGIYTKTHDFEHKFLSKANAKEQIDRLVQEDYNYFWNFLWGPGNKNIAGVEAISYLESKNVPMIGTSSRFLSMTKLDNKQAMALADIKTAKGITTKGDNESIDQLELGDLQFPLIIKPSVGCGNEHVTEESVCRDAIALEKQIRLLRSKLNENYEILIEEYIEGDEVAVMVIETSNGLIALHPLKYAFPDDWPSEKRILDWHTKLEGIERGDVTYKLFDGSAEMKEKIQETAIKAYQALGVLGSGYARVVFRVKGSELYVLEVNPCPAFFAPLGNTYGDDFVIESTFPGGHDNLVETIISAKRRLNAIIKEFDNDASKYDKMILQNEGKNLIEIWENLTDAYDYGGSVLDLGCGTGMVGKVIKKKYVAQMTGVDVSPEMVKLIDNYEKIHIGFMENIVMELNGKFSHVVSSGALDFVDNRCFEKLFDRMFRLATNSITLTITEMSEESLSYLAAKYNASLFNHADTVENFKNTDEWTLAYNQREYLWKSPRLGTDIYGRVVRYERKA